MTRTRLQKLEAQRFMEPHLVNRQVETALRLTEEISQPPHHVGAQLLAFGQKENG
ncbi:MAG: hypothetical protein M3480_04340 [Verrucomicrobiota bacterium]|nr:hypothetical protein [Verrucomicrobiota bacterium]